MTTVKGTLNVDEAVTLDTALDVTGATFSATGGGEVDISEHQGYDNCKRYLKCR